MENMASTTRRLLWSCALAFGIGFGWQTSTATAAGTCCFTDSCRCTQECEGDCVAYYCYYSVCDGTAYPGRCYLCDN